MGKHVEHIEEVEKLEIERLELERLETELRKLAVPYSSEEPGPMYWANFRVRVMDRVANGVAQKEEASLLQKVGGWLSAHSWQSGIAISAAAVLIAAVIVNPFFEKKESITPKAPVAQIAPAPAVPPPAQPQSTAVQSQPFEAPPMLAANHSSHRTHLSDQPKEDLAQAEEPEPESDISGTNSGGVSLQELSQPELEAVLQGLQSTE